MALLEQTGTSVEGRKLFLAGDCRDCSGEVVSTCEGLFIDAKEHFASLAAGEGQVD